MKSLNEYLLLKIKELQQSKIQQYKKSDKKIWLFRLILRGIYEKLNRNFCVLMSKIKRLQTMISRQISAKKTCNFFLFQQIIRELY